MPVPQRRFVDLPPAQRFMNFHHINWNRTFFKTYFEKRSFLHLVVNFNRIWVIHLSLFWFYTAFNSPTIYGNGNNQNPTPAMSWSATALGGAVATSIMILATVLEFLYIPTTWDNTAYLRKRLLFLFVVLIFTTGPTFYIFLFDDSSLLSLILGIAQFSISVAATLVFAIRPSGRMFYRVRQRDKSRRYLTHQVFTASYADVGRKSRFASIMLWVLIFACKFSESYFLLTLSFRDPIRVMVGMEVQGCHDTYFGGALCQNHAVFTLTIMYLTDMVLFFLDTFVWYVIWTTVFSIARLFFLGFSISTSWAHIYSRIPKRICTKILNTSNIENNSEVGCIHCARCP